METVPFEASMYDLPERSAFTFVSRTAELESPWVTVALGVNLQGIAHVLYMGSLLMLPFLSMMALDGPRGGPDREMGLVILGSAIVLAMSANMILSLVAGALMVSANVGSKARALGFAILTCTALIVLNLSGPYSYPSILMDRGFGRAFQETSLLQPTTTRLLMLGVLEVVRLSLIGFYVSAVATFAHKGALASNGHWLGVLIPIIELPLGAVAIVMLSATKNGLHAIGPLILVNPAVHLMLLVYAISLLLRLRGVANEVSNPLRDD